MADRNGEDNEDVVYLDVRLQTNSHGFRTTLYHKVENFDFHVVVLTFPDIFIIPDDESKYDNTVRPDLTIS